MNASQQTRVYAIFVEVIPGEGCELDAREHAGAFVRCYLPAADEMNATRILTTDLTHRRFRLVNIEWCVDHDATDWENPENEAQESCVLNARRSGSVVYSEFHTFGHDLGDE